MSGKAPESAGYEALAAFLRERAGLDFSRRPLDAEGGVKRAMLRAGLQDPRAYLTRLERGQASFDDLVAEVAVGETYFFREPAHFELVRDRVLPEFMKSRPAARPFRAWSAGCASGEEPYSLAIVLEEAGFAGRSQILATDLSKAALARAGRARYGEWSLRSLPEVRRERYFTRSEGSWKLAPRFPDRVRFEFWNMALDDYPCFRSGVWGFDLILCRNVLIYFDHRTIQAVGRRLYDSLSEGGWLIAGPSDPPLGASAPFETLVTDSGVYYRRPRRTSPPSFPRESGRTEPIAPRRAADAPPRPPAAAPRPAAKSARRGQDGVQEAYDRGDYPSVLRLSEGTADPKIALLRLRALANLRGVEAAEAAAARAAARHPTSIEILLLRAVLLMDIGRDEDARRTLRRALYLDRAAIPAHFLSGCVLRRLGDSAAARRSLRSAERLAAGYPPEAVVPYSEGESAAQLRRAISAQLAMIGGDGPS